MPGPGGDQVAIDHRRLIHVGCAALLDIEGALGDRRKRPAADAAGRGENLDAVTERGHRLTGLEEMPSEPQQVLVIAEILRGPAA